MKYKLIKEYPGSPKIGTIERIDHTSSIHMMINGHYGYSIKNSPEFWEEIVEKDYEILSFKGILDSNNGLFTLRPNNNYYWSIWNNNHPGQSLENMLKWNTVIIYSIKRLSDGEIFTIGDEIESVCKPYKSYLIERIDIKDNKIRIYGKSFLYSLDRLKHSKKPLFTTEDGVEMFKGDKYWVVYDGYKLSNSAFTADIDYRLSITDLRFASHKEAKEYCFNNKPALSLNDVKKNFKGDDDQWSELITKLEKIVNKTS